MPGLHKDEGAIVFSFAALLRARARVARGIEGRTEQIANINVRRKLHDSVALPSAMVNGNSRIANFPRSKRAVSGKDQEVRDRWSIEA